MKRFFTFLMAVWALLSISQTVKADYVTVYFQCPNDWSTTVHAYAYNTDTDKNSNWDDAPAGSEFTTSNGVKLWKCTFDSKYKYVIFKGPGKMMLSSIQDKMKKVWRSKIIMFIPLRVAMEPLCLILRRPILIHIH